jgi:nucleoside-diphosphate-sugar epimerase
VAQRLPLDSFVITSRREEQCAVWREHSWKAETANIESMESLKNLFSRYPNARVLVDSVPPLRIGVPSRGVENVVEALRDTRIERVIYLSTTGVFGGRDGQIVDESTPPGPWNEQGQARLDCEKVYRSETERGARFVSTSLRLPAIYGEDRGLLTSLASGTYRMVDEGALWTNRIHVEDLAQVIVKAIQAPSLPEVLCVGDDEPALARDVVSFLCNAHGLSRPGSISSRECVARGAYTMVSNQRINNKRMKELLGLVLTYPSYREGMGIKR